jgi:hypothetical protein
LSRSFPLAVKAVVVVKRARVSRRRRQPVLIPARGETEARFHKLSYFDPYDTQQLLTDARAIAESQGMALDAAVNVTLYANQKMQLEKLLTCLGCETSSPDWKTAFFKLAQLCCNVGRLVHHPSGNISNARTWTLEDESNLLTAVRRLREDGFSERDAIKILGEDPSYDAIFPHREQTPGRRAVKRRARADEWHEGSRAERTTDSRQSRVNALWKRWQRLNRKIKNTSDGFADTIGATHMSEFELSLWLLNLPPTPPKALP